MDGYMEGRGGVSLDSHLIVVGRELMEQLFDAVFLSRAVHIGHLVLRQGAVVLMDLSEGQRERGELKKNTHATCKQADKCKIL